MPSIDGPEIRVALLPRATDSDTITRPADHDHVDQRA
jgi:hypothetical protein